MLGNILCGCICILVGYYYGRHIEPRMAKWLERKIKNYEDNDG